MTKAKKILEDIGTVIFFVALLAVAVFVLVITNDPFHG